MELQELKTFLMDTLLDFRNWYIEESELDVENLSDYDNGFIEGLHSSIRLINQAEIQDAVPTE